MTKALEITTFLVILFNSGKSVEIVNGKNAEQGQFPFTVSWCLEENGLCHTICGGAIYNENTIITSGFCCYAMNIVPGLHLDQTRIVAGELDLTQISGFEQIRRIQNYVIHPDYDQFDNDLCLLTLESPLQFNDQVYRIHLQTENTNESANCIFSGFGALGQASH